MAEDQDRRRDQDRDKYRREREERRLKAEREEEIFQRELEERKRRRDEERRLREEERQRAEEEHQRALDKRRKQRESDLLKKLAEFDTQSRRTTYNRTSTMTARSEARSLFSLFKSMKTKYSIAPPIYFSNLVSKEPDAGEITRYFEHFKEELTKPGVRYKNFPINHYEKNKSAADREVLLRLIDVQDEDGFTALHWAVFGSNATGTELLLKLGASLEVKTFLNKHTPIDKIQHGYKQAEMHEVIRKYEDINKSARAANKIAQQKTAQNITTITRRDSSPFPFLELPIELQFVILEQLSVGTMLTMRCICKYFKELQISNNHVAALPDMGKFQFLDPPNDGFNREKQCTLTIVATPTVFHFGMIMGHSYEPPRPDPLVLQRLIARIKKYAAEDGFWKYDLEKLQEFLLNDKVHRKTYVLVEDLFWSKISVYVELDQSFGVGVEFVSPGDPNPFDDDW